MKKIVIFLLLVCGSVQAGPYARLEMGPSTQIPEYMMTEAEIGLRFDLWKFKNDFYGSWLTWAVTDGNVLQNKPFMDIYTLGAKISYRYFFLRFEHYCAHPVNGSYYVRKNEYGEKVFTRYYIAPKQWMGGAQTLTAGIEFELK